MPNVRRRIVDCRVDWVDCQFARRDSRGWVDDRSGDEEELDCCCRRRVSGRPGAEGAPRETEVVGVNFEG